MKKSKFKVILGTTLVVASLTNVHAVPAKEKSIKTLKTISRVSDATDVSGMKDAGSKTEQRR